MEIEKNLVETLPGLRVLPLRLEGLSIHPSDSNLEALKKEVQDRVRQSIKSQDEIRDKPVFRAYRDFFWNVGIDPTKTRPAGEALTRRVYGGRDLPTINTLVDSYNLASIETYIAIAAFDAEKLNFEDLYMRKAQTGESFHGIGMQSPSVLRGVEVVIEDKSSKDLVAIYPYRDSEASKVTLETSDVLLLMCGVPSIPEEALENAKLISKDYILRFCKQQSFLGV